MTTTANGSGFPVARALLWLAAVAVAGGAALLALGAAIFDAPEAPRAIVAGGAAAYVATLLGLLPVIAVASLGVMATVYAYFIGAAVRLVVCLASLLMAVKVLAMPPAPLVLGLALYLPLLMVEVGLIGRHLWPQSVEADRPGGSSPAEAAGLEAVR